MTKTAFTPGPWTADDYFVLEGDTSNPIAEIFTLAHEDTNLIAAAPDLYAALAEMTEVYWGVRDDRNGDGGPPPACIVKARAGLAKALGNPSNKPTKSGA